jgi:eukaryotic-like serine/threonine-protein kinase
VARVARVLEHWPHLKASFLLPLRCTGLELRFTRARAALAAASTLARADATPPRGVDPRWTRRALLDEVRTEIRAIDGDAIAFGRPVARLLRAGVARIEGREQEAERELLGAVAGFDDAGMALYREGARYARGDLVGGAEGAAMKAQAAAWMEARGVVQPRAMTAALAPGLGVLPG